MKGSFNMTKAEAIVVLRELAKSLEMDAMLDHAEQYTVKPTGDGDGDSAVFNSNGELVDDRGELFWALAHLICHTVPNVEFRSKYQPRFDEFGNRYYY